MWVTFPMYEVLQLTSMPFPPGIEDCFDFVFFLVLDDRGGACEGCAICFRLLIWQEEVHVEDVVDFH